jgi:Tol biopolymer transport system component
VLKVDSRQVEGLLIITPEPFSCQVDPDLKDTFVRPSPDGKRLAYARFEPQADPRSIGIFLLDTIGGEPRQIWDKGYVSAWGPGGKWLVASIRIAADKPRFPPRYETWRIDVDGSSARRLPIPATDAVQDVAPDGKRIVTVSTRHWQEKERRSDLYLMNLDGTEHHRLTLTHTSSGAHSPRFSPDGARLAYIHRENQGKETRLSLRILALATGESRTVYDVPWEDFWEGLCWSPDGKTLASCVHTAVVEPDGTRRVLSNETNKYRIVLIDPDGRNLRPLPIPDTVRLGPPDWR